MIAWSSSSSLSGGASEQTPLCSARPKKHRYQDGRSDGRTVDLGNLRGRRRSWEDHRDNECRSSVFFFVVVVNSLEEVKFGRFRQQPRAIPTSSVDHPAVGSSAAYSVILAAINLPLVVIDRRDRDHGGDVKSGRENPTLLESVSHVGPFEPPLPLLPRLRRWSGTR